MDRKYAAPNTNNRKFFFCTHYYATACQFCPEGLLFNEPCQTCIREGENCYIPQTTATTTTTTTQAAPPATTTTTTQAPPPTTTTTTITKPTTTKPTTNCEFIQPLF